PLKNEERAEILDSLANIDHLAGSRDSRQDSTGGHRDLNRLPLAAARQRLAVRRYDEAAAADHDSNRVARENDRRRPEQLTAKRLSGGDIAGCDPSFELTAIGECVRRISRQLDPVAANVVGYKGVAPADVSRRNRHRSEDLHLRGQKHSPRGAFDAA